MMMMMMMMMCNIIVSLTVPIGIVVSLQRKVIRFKSILGLFQDILSCNILFCLSVVLFDILILKGLVMILIFSIFLRFWYDFS